ASAEPSELAPFSGASMAQLRPYRAFARNRDFSGSFQDIGKKSPSATQGFAADAVAAVERHPAGLPALGHEVTVQLFGQGEGQNGILPTVTLKDATRRLSFEPG